MASFGLGIHASSFLSIFQYCVSLLLFVFLLLLVLIILSLLPILATLLTSARGWDKHGELGFRTDAEFEVLGPRLVEVYIWAEDEG